MVFDNPSVTMPSLGSRKQQFRCEGRGFAKRLTHPHSPECHINICSGLQLF